MKQRILLSFFFVFTFIINSNAQIGKGSVWLGGYTAYSMNKVTDNDPSNEKSRRFTFSPAVGKAVKENLIMGIKLTYLNNMEKHDISSETGSDSRNKSYSGGLFLRRYIPVIGRLFAFGEGSASYGISRQTSKVLNNGISAETKTKGWSAALGFSPGVSYGISKKLQLESGFNSLFNAYYSNSKSTSGPNTTKSESFSGGISLENESTFYIGFRILFNKG